MFKINEVPKYVINKLKMKHKAVVTNNFFQFFSSKPQPDISMSNLAYEELIKKMNQLLINDIDYKISDRRESLRCQIEETFKLLDCALTDKFGLDLADYKETLKSIQKELTYKLDVYTKFDSYDVHNPHPMR